MSSNNASGKVVSVDEQAFENAGAYPDQTAGSRLMRTDPD